MEAIEILPNIPEIRWIDDTLNRTDWGDVWKNMDKTKLTEKVIAEFEKLLGKGEEE